MGPPGGPHGLARDCWLLHAAGRDGRCHMSAAKPKNEHLSVADLANEIEDLVGGLRDETDAATLALDDVQHFTSSGLETHVEDFLPVAKRLRECRKLSKLLEELVTELCARLEAERPEARQ